MNSLETVFGAFKHLGEVHLLEFILDTLDTNTMRYYHNNDRTEQIQKKYDLAPSSQYRYLSNMVKNGVLEKVGKGKYKVMEKWIEYGN
jgi:DNA-binding IclR family transcriptional regulator